MYKVKVHNRVNQIMSLLYVFEIWQDNKHSGFRIWFSKVMHFTVCVYYPIGLFVASLLNDKIEAVFMGVGSVSAFVQAARVYYFYSNKDQIIELVRTLGTHINRKKELNQLYFDVDSKIKRFVDFASVFHLLVILELPIILLSALISHGKHLPLDLYFPLNWKDSEFGYWFAFGFTSCSVAWYCCSTMLNVIIWYLMMSCAMKYEILGNEFRLIGVATTKETLVKKPKTFVEELIEFIQNHQRLQDITTELKTTFSNLFFIQVTTSGINICGTVFTLAFVSTTNLFVLVFYFVAIVYFAFEIFMVAYLGNEIKLWSSRLSYCLFECDWVNQSKSRQKRMVILMEVLKRPQQLVVGKIYPLDLNIFTKILNFAYSMFNVLMGFR